MGIAKASKPYGDENAPSMCYFRYLRRVKMETVQNGDLASVFLPTKKANF